MRTQSEITNQRDRLEKLIQDGLNGDQLRGFWLALCWCLGENVEGIEVNFLTHLVNDPEIKAIIDKLME